VAIALIYALFAGLRTVGDPDIGWQLATGRWIIQHRAIPYTDILSYTASGQEWVYPVLSQVIFYWLYLLGGYSLLSWFSAAACVGTTALVLGSNTITRCLALVAVPLIAERTAPRAELFTELLFAAFVSILWHYHRSGRGPLWSLPPLMFLWVNLHLGFVSGLGMCAAYIFLELGDALVAERRPSALSRLRNAAPWLIATFVATLLNPWGPRNYVGMVRVLPVHSSAWVAELMSVPVTLSTIAQAFAWRDPRSAFWWLIFAVIVAMLVSVCQRRVAPAVLFGISLYLVIHAIRFKGPFAIIAVVIGGSILADGIESAWVRRVWQRVQLAASESRLVPVMLVSMIALTAFAGVRVWDLVTNRYYLRTSFEYSIFGPGVSWWYPEDAAAFVKRERLPGNVFNDYNSGGFVAWRLSPEYPDYIDGRGNPFGAGLFFRSQELLGESLDSPQWEQEATSRDINTILVSLDLDMGRGLPNLDQFCQSRAWRPVFLDTQAAVFVRVRPETAGLLSRLQLDCENVQFDTPPPAIGIRGKAEQFNYYRNSAAILIVLGRNSEAQHQLALAKGIFSGSSDLHYLQGLASLYTGQTTDAEKELRTSLSIEPSDQTSRALAGLYRQQGRYPEAVTILGRAAEYSVRPYRLYLELGLAELEMGMPAQALIAFDKAEKQSPFIGEADPLGTEFNALLAEGRANAWRRLRAPGSKQPQ
jgi:hypothetical protein